MKSINLDDIKKAYGKSEYHIPIIYLERNMAFEENHVSSSLFQNGQIPKFNCNEFEWWERSQSRIENTLRFKPEAIYTKPNIDEDDTEGEAPVAAKRMSTPFAVAKDKNATTGMLYPAGSYLVLSEQMIEDPQSGEAHYHYFAMTESEFNKTYTIRHLKSINPSLKPFVFIDSDVATTQPYATQLSQIIIDAKISSGSATSAHIESIKNEVGRKVTVEYLDRLKTAYENGANYGDYSTIFNTVANDIAPKCEIITATPVFKRAASMGALIIARNLFLEDQAEGRMRQQFSNQKTDKFVQDWANHAADDNQYYESSIPFVFGLVDSQLPRSCANINEATRIVETYKGDYVSDQFNNFAGGNQTMLTALRKAYAPKIETYFDSLTEQASQNIAEHSRLNALKTTVKMQYGVS